MPPKSDLSRLNCSLARGLNAVGDWWSLLIVREAVIGTTRFARFQAALGIARNILTRRLGSLVEAGVLERRGTDKRPTYHLTEKGLALVPALIALTQWGDRWESHDLPPVLFSSAFGEAIAPVGMFTVSGTAVSPLDMTMSPGPGADEATTKHILAAQDHRH